MDSQLLLDNYNLLHSYYVPMDMIELKPYPPCPKYHVSSDGEQILNTKTGRTLHIGEQVMSGKPTGYMYVTLLYDDEMYVWKRTAVHRLVLIAFKGVDPTKPWANHKNGIRSDNRIENLEWTTPAENSQHSFNVLGRMRTVPRGANHWQYGKKASTETKHKMSIKKLGKNHPKYKGLYIVFGRKYYSALECERLTGICQKTVIRRCHNPKNIDYSFIPDPNREF